MKVKYLYIALSRYYKLVDECLVHNCGSNNNIDCAFCFIMTHRHKTISKIYQLQRKLQANKILRGNKQCQEKIH